jgi:4-amino-4-deoxy-L-arabinose transferase-like glycosyltransferase
MIAINKNIGYISASILLLLIFLLPHQIIWDEKWYLNCVTNINKYGFSINFLKYNPTAPIHTLIYYLFDSIFGIHAIGVRLFNFLLCICLCLLLNKIIKLNQNASSLKLGYSFSLFTLPCFFVLGFFALTEAPCLLLYLISFYFLFKSVNADKNNIALSIASGLFLGLAILTRQLFLVSIFPPLVIFFYKGKKHRFSVIMPYLLVSLLMCLPVFYLWKGILPPNTPIMPHPQGIISLKHVALSFGYALFYFIVALPVYLFNFIAKNKKGILLISLAGIVISFFIKDNSFLPASGALSRFQPAVIQTIALLFFKLITVFGLILVYFLLHELHKRKNEFEQVFLILSMLAILATPAFITHFFSSRYPLQISPLLIIFAYSRLLPVNPKFQFLINSICIAISLVSVVTFFY